MATLHDDGIDRVLQADLADAIVVVLLLLLFLLRWPGADHLRAVQRIRAFSGILLRPEGGDFVVRLGARWLRDFLWTVVFGHGSRKVNMLGTPRSYVFSNFFLSFGKL